MFTFFYIKIFHQKGIYSLFIENSEEIKEKVELTVIHLIIIYITFHPISLSQREIDHKLENFSKISVKEK